MIDLTNHSKIQNVVDDGQIIKEEHLIGISGFNRDSNKNLFSTLYSGIADENTIIIEINGDVSYYQGLVVINHEIINLNTVGIYDGGNNKTTFTITTSQRGNIMTVAEGHNIGSEVFSFDIVNVKSYKFQNQTDIANNDIYKPTNPISTMTIFDESSNWSKKNPSSEYIWKKNKNIIIFQGFNGQMVRVFTGYSDNKTTDRKEDELTIKFCTKMNLYYFKEIEATKVYKRVTLKEFFADRFSMSEDDIIYANNTQESDYDIVDYVKTSEYKEEKELIRAVCKATETRIAFNSLNKLVISSTVRKGNLSSDLSVTIDSSMMYDAETEREDGLVFNNISCNYLDRKSLYDRSEFSRGVLTDFGDSQEFLPLLKISSNTVLTYPLSNSLSINFFNIYEGNKIEKGENQSGLEYTNFWLNSLLLDTDKVILGQYKNISGDFRYDYKIGTIEDNNKMDIDTINNYTSSTIFYLMQSQVMEKISSTKIITAMATGGTNPYSMDLEILNISNTTVTGNTPLTIGNLYGYSNKIKIVVISDSRAIVSFIDNTIGLKMDLLDITGNTPVILDSYEFGGVQSSIYLLKYDSQSFFALVDNINGTDYSIVKFSTLGDTISGEYGRYFYDFSGAQLLQFNNTRPFKLLYEDSNFFYMGTLINDSGIEDVLYFKLYSYDKNSISIKELYSISLGKGLNIAIADIEVLESSSDGANVFIQYNVSSGSMSKNYLVLRINESFTNNLPIEEFRYINYEGASTNDLSLQLLDFTIDSNSNPQYYWKDNYAKIDSSEIQYFGIKNTIVLKDTETDMEFIAKIYDVDIHTNTIKFKAGLEKDKFLDPVGRLKYLADETFNINAEYVKKSLDVSIPASEFNPVNINIDEKNSTLYVLGESNDTIMQYNFNDPNELATASYVQSSPTFDAQTTRGVAIFFNNDYTKMYLLGNYGKLWQYSLSVAGQINTLTYDGIFYDYTGQISEAIDMTFNPNENKLYILENRTSTLFEYYISNLSDISTMSYTGKQHTFTEDSLMGGLYFNDEGDRAILLGANNMQFFSYQLNKKWDIDSFYYDGKFFDYSFISSSGDFVYLLDDGSQMYTGLSGHGKLFQYIISDSWDISSIEPLNESSTRSLGEDYSLPRYFRMYYQISSLPDVWSLTLKEGDNEQKTSNLKYLIAPEETVEFFGEYGAVQRGQETFSGIVEENENIFGTFTNNELLYNKDLQQQIPIYIQTNKYTNESSVDDNDFQLYYDYDNSELTVKIEPDNSNDNDFRILLTNNNTRIELDEILPNRVKDNALFLPTTNTLKVGDIIMLSNLNDGKTYYTDVTKVKKYKVISVNEIENQKVVFLNENYPTNSFNSSNSSDNYYFNTFNEEAFIELNQIKIKGNPVMETIQPYNYKNTISQDDYGVIDYEINGDIIDLETLKIHIDNIQTVYDGSGNAVFPFTFNLPKYLQIEAGDAVRVTETYYLKVTDEPVLILDKAYSSTSNEYVYKAILIGDYTPTGVDINLNSSIKYQPINFPEYYYNDDQDVRLTSQDTSSDFLTTEIAGYGYAEATKIPISAFFGVSLVSGTDQTSFNSLNIQINLNNSSSRETYSQALLETGTKTIIKVGQEFILIEGTEPVDETTNSTVVKILSRNLFGSNSYEFTNGKQVDFYETILTFSGHQDLGVGYYTGGYKASNLLTARLVEKYDYLTQTVTNPTSQLNVARRNLGGLSSDSNGYYVGGTDNVNPLGQVEEINFKTDAISDLGSILSTTMLSMATASYKTKGYMKGGTWIYPSVLGAQQSWTFSFDYITYTQLLAEATSTFRTEYATGVQSSKVGYFAGGSDETGIIRNTIEGFDFITETKKNITDVLVVSRTGLSGINSSSYGYFLGGQGISGYSNEIDGINFISETIINPIETLSAQKGQACTSSGLYKGVIAGGNTSGGGISTIEEFDFSTEITTVSSATLSGTRWLSAGTGTKGG